MPASRAIIRQWTGRTADVDRHPGKLGGQWCIKGTRVPIQAIIDNAGDGFTAEQIATEIFGLPVEVVRRVLAWRGCDG
jgi:uncharacterized protein (DUF433 family)